MIFEKIQMKISIFSGDIPDLMKLLEHSIYSNKPKNVDIFPLAEKVKHIFITIIQIIFISI